MRKSCCVIRKLTVDQISKRCGASELRLHILGHVSDRGCEKTSEADVAEGDSSEQGVSEKVGQGAREICHKNTDKIKFAIALKFSIAIYSV